MNRERRAVIRADGNKSLGMGHLNRACDLARHLSDRHGFDCRLAVRDDSHAKAFLDRREVDAIWFPEQMPREREYGSLLDMAHSTENPLMVFDLLRPNTYDDLLHQLKQEQAVSLVVCDSLTKLDVPADLVLAANPSQLRHRYDEPKYLVGPRYFPMDARYRDATVKPPSGHPSRIALCLGGSDLNDLLFRVLVAIERAAPDATVELATSRATGYLDRLKRFVAGRPLKCRLHLDLPGLVDFWPQADVAITAGGNTLFERVASRLPGATVCQLRQQVGHADGLEELGVNCNLGFGPELTDRRLVEQIDRFLHDHAQQKRHHDLAPQAVDGRGLDRLSAALEARYEAA